MKLNLIKIGGSVFSEKSVPFSRNTTIIKNLCLQICHYYKEIQLKKKDSEKIVLIHGGGSFGHPIAKRYGIQNGKNKDFEDQLWGLAKTHQVMDEINAYFVKTLMDLKIPTIPIQPSSVFFNNNGHISISCKNQLINLLNNDMIPILYGDIILNNNNSFSILSGDEIIQVITNYFITNKELDITIEKIVFCFNQKGILDENGTLISKIKFNELDKVILRNNNEDIDVTGGFLKKIRELGKLKSFDIGIYFLKGHIDQNLLHILENQPCISTIIEKEKKKLIE